MSALPGDYHRIRMELSTARNLMFRRRSLVKTYSVMKSLPGESHPIISHSDRGFRENTVFQKSNSRNFVLLESSFELISCRLLVRTLTPLSCRNRTCILSSSARCRHF
jgi:hypothetical protein